MQIECRLQEIYHHVIYGHQRKLCYYGGRGGGKSYGIAIALVILILSEKERAVNYCCLRETQKTLQDSSKSILMWAIEMLGVGHLFHTSRTSDEILCKLNGCTFKFRGIGTLSDAHRFKSINNVKIAWIDEAQTMKEEVWDLFTPSVRHTDSRIIVSFNPDKKTDFIYDAFILNPSREAKVIKVNYYNNPFFFENKALVCEMKEMRECYPLKFKHVWLGGTSTGQGQILNPRWFVRYNNIDEALRLCHTIIITADTAYKTKEANDYSVLQAWAYNLDLRQCYLVDCIRQKLAFPDLVKTSIDFWNKWSTRFPNLYPEKMWIEDKASGTSLAQTLQDKIGDNYVAPWQPKWFHFPDDKVSRANEAAVLMANSVFYIPTQSEETPWANCFVNECADFEADSEGFDDQVDAFTMAASVVRYEGINRVIA